MTSLRTFLAGFLLLTAASLGGCQAKMESSGADENVVENMAVAEEDAQNASDEYNEAATEAGQPLPEFRIPAPRPSAQMSLPRALLPPGEPTLQQVDDALRARLTAARYDRVGYYRVTNGFALATQMERIGSDGKPFAGTKRWATEASGLASISEGLSLRSMMDALLHADPGSYRVLVFVVTNRPVTSTAASMTSEVAKKMVVEGPSDLPQGFAEARFGPDYRATVLIYEFNRTAVGKPAQFSSPSTRSAAEQLRLANVLEG